MPYTITDEWDALTTYSSPQSSKQKALGAARRVARIKKIRVVVWDGHGHPVATIDPPQRKKGNPYRKNPTKAQKRLNASKRSKQKRMTTALRKFLHQVNPAINTVAIHKLKGGVLKITPIKANPRSGYDPAWRWAVQRWENGEWVKIDPSFDTKREADSNAALWRRGGWKVRVVHPRGKR